MQTLTDVMTKLTAKFAQVMLDKHSAATAESVIITAYSAGWMNGLAAGIAVPEFATELALTAVTQESLDGLLKYWRAEAHEYRR